MFIPFWELVLFFQNLIGYHPNIGNPEIEINDGKLRGTILKNHKGEDVYAFLGIPYAQPPLGELRFKAPLPNKPWRGVRDATSDGNQCWQTNFAGFSPDGSENCLFLNVFTKSVKETKKLKPVLVYIHGGGFMLGSSDSKTYPPGYLLMEDIVLVTFNYRVGIFGFLKLEDPTLGVPGNAGLKDQVLALKWVQKNIKRFGGDPNNVGLFGHSAGAASVNYQMLSPSSKGLFHKAILLSGTVLNPWPSMNNVLEATMGFLNSSSKNDADILEILMKTPAKDINIAQDKMLEGKLYQSGVYSFAPCIEDPNETAFLTERPIDILTSGNYHKVPVIVSFISNEGMFFDHTMKFKNIKLNLNWFIPADMHLSEDDEQAKEICKKLEEAYLSKNPNYYDEIIGDGFFAAGVIGLAKNLALTNTEPTYLQKFSLTTSRNIYKKTLGITHSGASHGDELGYLFNTDLQFPYFPILRGSIEEKAVIRYIKLLSNFLKYGNPTPDITEFGIIWEPVTENHLCYLDIDMDLSLKKDPYKKRMSVWKDIFGMHENTKDYMP